MDGSPLHRLATLLDRALRRRHLRARFTLIDGARSGFPPDRTRCHGRSPERAPRCP